MRFFPFLLVLVAELAPLVSAERLDRGLVAFPAAEGGVYLGWRLLAGILRGRASMSSARPGVDGPRTKVNAAPISDSTNFGFHPGPSRRFLVFPISLRAFRDLDVVGHQV